MIYGVGVCPNFNKESLSFNFTGRGNYCVKTMDYYVVGQTPIWWMLTKIRLARICELHLALIAVNDIHRLVRFTWADWCLSLFKFIATTFFALFYVQMVYAHEFVATFTLQYNELF